MNANPTTRLGGYDEGYAACPLFWGDQPSSLILELTGQIDVRGWKVLDIGGGEGKNAHFLSALGAQVELWDVSAIALENGRSKWPEDAIKWIHRDAMELSQSSASFDLVIAYGLLHCMDQSEIEPLVRAIQAATVRGGYNAVVTFNSRSQDIAKAHPGFNPTLIPHERYSELYSGWQMLRDSDSDLHESHPHNNVPHTHSMTRILAQKPANG